MLNTFFFSATPDPCPEHNYCRSSWVPSGGEPADVGTQTCQTDMIVDIGTQTAAQDIPVVDFVSILLSNFMNIKLFFL